MATIPLGLYLWKRIHQAGIETVMGLPGDFNLNFLDFIYDVPGLNWVGNANELNAAYAADGYARVKGVPGCLVTTHGVGELSAINGIAGAASEHISVIHVVGQTPRMAQENHKMIHHSIGTSPDHQIYNKMSKPIRCAAAELWDPKDAPAEIDRVLRECFIQHLPVYIFFPIDLTAEPVPEHLLDTPLDLSLPIDSESESSAINAITEALYASKNPCVFLDHLVHSHGESEARKLVDDLGLPVYASHMGKGIVDENHACYVGLYNGGVSLPGICDAFEASDLVLALGWWPTDSNSAAFTRNISPEKRIDVLDDYVIVKGHKFSGVYMGPLLSKLSSTLTKSSLPTVSRPTLPTPSPVLDASATHITQTYIWPRLGDFLRPGDVLINDTGTAAFGLPDATFPPSIHYICQTYYGSIGYATPCALGAELALREEHAKDPSKPRRRTILVTGDGSLQLTIQEIGTMVAQKLQPIVIIINNAGYTIERAIHGARAQYNDIAPYNYSAMLTLFSPPADAANTHKRYREARTKEEFEAALRDANFADPKEVQVLEVHMDKLDIPWRLAQLLIRRDAGFVKYLSGEGFTNSEE